MKRPNELTNRTPTLGGKQTGFSEGLIELPAPEDSEPLKVSRTNLADHKPNSATNQQVWNVSHPQLN